MENTLVGCRHLRSLGFHDDGLAPAAPSRSRPAL